MRKNISSIACADTNSPLLKLQQPQSAQESRSFFARKRRFHFTLVAVLQPPFLHKTPVKTRIRHSSAAPTDDSRSKRLGPLKG